MQRKEIIEALSKFNFEDFINQNMCVNKIKTHIEKQIGKDKCPCNNPISKYIKENYNYEWDKQRKCWFASQESPNSNTKGKKKRCQKNPPTLTTVYESKIEEENSHTDNSITSKIALKEDEKQRLESTPIDSLKEEKSNTASDKEESSFSEKSSLESSSICDDIHSKKYKVSDLKTIKDENISPLDYTEYILASESSKISISINSFILELVKQRVYNHHGISPENNRSKIIQMALYMYLKLSK